MYSCIQCGESMYQSINSLCGECQISYNSRQEMKVMIKNKLHKGYLIRMIKGMMKNKPSGVYSHGDSKSYNRAIIDVMKMIDQNFS